jgi:hypothetical protein
MDIDAIRARYVSWPMRKKPQPYYCMACGQSLAAQDDNQVLTSLHRQARLDIPDLLTEIDRLTALVKVCEGALEQGKATCLRHRKRTDLFACGEPNCERCGQRDQCRINVALAAVRGEAGCPNT